MALWVCTRCEEQANGDPEFVVAAMSAHKCPGRPKPADPKKTT